MSKNTVISLYDFMKETGLPEIDESKREEIYKNLDNLIEARKGKDPIRKARRAVKTSVA